MITECPIDPNYPFLFFGEEHVQSARYYTHGYQFFTPMQALVRHQWSRSSRYGTYWEQWTNNPEKVNQELISRIRLQTLLGMNQSPFTEPKYGLGKVKTLQQFENYTGGIFEEKL